MLEQTQHIDGRIIEQICRQTLPDTGDRHLLDKIQMAHPNCSIRLARTGHEWYRLGGIVDDSGKRIARNLIEWAEQTYLESGQDFHAVIDLAMQGKLIATRHKGVTLYIVAQTGDSAEHFVQIEVDKTQEVADRLLVSEQHLPDDLQDMIDPIASESVEAFSVGASRYRYRRLTDVALFILELARHHAETHPVQRFMDDWNRSSAGQKAIFCHDWNLRLYQHTGRFGEQIMNAQVINVQQKQLPHLEDIAGKRGNTLNGLLTRFDRQAGYPFAWYFYMVKGLLVSPHSGEAVHQDLSGDFAYLPKRDAQVLRNWIEKPYSV